LSFKGLLSWTTVTGEGENPQCCSSLEEGDQELMGDPKANSSDHKVEERAEGRDYRTINQIAGVGREAKLVDNKQQKKRKTACLFIVNTKSRRIST
jgi:hypothetical protein